MALVSLTEGVTRLSRIVAAAWQALYAVNPAICGGCRPVRLATLVSWAGFEVAGREVVVQLGVPSEVVVAVR